MNLPVKPEREWPQTERLKLINIVREEMDKMETKEIENLVLLKNLNMIIRRGEKGGGGIQISKVNFNVVDGCGKGDSSCDICNYVYKSKSLSQGYDILQLQAMIDKIHIELRTLRLSLSDRRLQLEELEGLLNCGKKEVALCSGEMAEGRMLASSKHFKCNEQSIFTNNTKKHMETPIFNSTYYQGYLPFNYRRLPRKRLPRNHQAPDSDESECLLQQQKEHSTNNNLPAEIQKKSVLSIKTYHEHKTNENNRETEIRTRQIVNIEVESIGNLL